MILVLGYIAAAVIVWWIGGMSIAFILSCIYREQDGLATMAVIAFFEIAWTVLCVVGGALFVGFQIGAAA